MFVGLQAAFGPQIPQVDPYRIVGRVVDRAHAGIGADTSVAEVAIINLPASPKLRVDAGCGEIIHLIDHRGEPGTVDAYFLGQATDVIGAIEVVVPPIGRDPAVRHKRGRHDAATGVFGPVGCIKYHPTRYVRAGFQVIVDHGDAEAIVRATLVHEPKTQAIDAHAVGVTMIEEHLVRDIDVRDISGGQLHAWRP